MKNDKPIFPISVIANILQVHQRTLRIYDEENLLSPNRSPKHRRLYSLDDVERGKLIQYMTKECGLNLQGIKMVMAILNAPVQYDLSLETLKDIAEDIGLTPEMQQQNRIKLSRRGRKKKVIN